MIVQHEDVACVTIQFCGGAGDSYVAFVDTTIVDDIFATNDSAAGFVVGQSKHWDQKLSRDRVAGDGDGGHFFFETKA